MNKIIAKIKVASHSGLVTALVCLAQPTSSFASDIELYRPPQDKDMTLMFMLDVSGSMNPDSNTYSENRIQSLKDGMLALLQGNNPLPDKLITGLSTFNDKTGRIKLEAKPLNTLYPVGGNRQVFRTTITYKQNVTRTITTTTNATDTQERAQTARSKCDGYVGPLTGICYGSYINNGNYSPSDADTGWVNKGSSSSSTSSSNPSWNNVGSPVQQGSTISQECTAWNADNTICNNWVTSSKQATDFPNATPLSPSTTPPVSVPGTFNPGTPIPNPPSPGSWESPVPSDEDCKSSGCTRKQTRIRKSSSSNNKTESETQSFNTTVVYSGTVYETHRQRMIDAVNALRAINGTPTAFAYAEVAAYMMGQTTKSKTGSGFTESTLGSTTTENNIVKKNGIRDENNYFNPPAVDGTKTCNSQGIYFLTDGVPEYSNRVSAQSIMQASLNDTNFTCSDTSLDQPNNFYDDCKGWNASKTVCKDGWYSSDNKISKLNWQCISTLSKKLFEGKIENNVKLNNPTGASILTAVVGFGSDMASDTPTDSFKNDIAAAKKWGEIGGGGFYKGNNAQSIVDSVSAFLNKLNKYIPSVTVGSATIPIDALDTQNVQPWAYFPQFDPKPSNSAANVITWLGNVKKYKTLNNSLVDRGNTSVLENTGLLKDDTNDFWADTSITKVITKEVNGVKVESTVKVGGALSQLILGYDSTKTPSERRIFTDRKIVVDPNDANANIVSAIDSGDLKQLGKADFISSSTNKFKEDPKRGYILSLFGYNVNKSLADGISISAKDANSQTQLEQLLASTANLRQMGAVMHSRPVLLTQSGKTKFVDDVLTYDKRDDLILFGTTQGVLHVVKAGETGTDSNAGKELFSFVPNEMIENQSQAFLNQESQAGTLGYGVDGQWTAYTEYVTKKGSASTDEPVVTVKGGKQWVYGGLRMGGRSYYSLDLTDVSSTDNASAPKLKFHINPTGICASGEALGCMGQSWSKPTIASVNWKGKRKLVMFVGGGYDMGYEAGTYNQDNGNGAGVYMFGADNGDLLWWSSSNPSASSNAEDGTNALKVDDMKYSVVSQIKTVDRNNDGLVDHLYFGDLGGQVWRVDLDNNQKSKTEAFAKRAVKLLNLNKADGTSARFYTTPSFTIHNGGASGLFAALSIGSGDLSSPMSAPSSAGKDAIYVIYDKDVVKSNLYQLPDTSLVSKDMAIGTVGNTLASNTDGNTKTDITRGGWYYPLSAKRRVLNDGVAIDSDLYVSVFDASKDIDELSCTGGVRGESNVEQFCLPYGNCTKIESGQPVTKTRPVSIFLGKGNIGVAFGGTTGESSSNRSLVVNVKKDNPTFTNYAGNLKLVSQRWYEKYAKAR